MSEGELMMPTPAKRVSEITPNERLQSLTQWAEEQKYVKPGEGGTLPSGPRGIATMALGGPMGYSDQPQYTAPIGPPSYEIATKQTPEKKKGVVRRWLEKRQRGKDGEKSEETG